MADQSTKITFTGSRLPPRAGVGLKADHYHDILDSRPDIGWFEIHPENYMGAGGPPHHFLTAIRERYPLSIHGVGLSIGGAEPLAQAHLSRLKQLVERYQPASFSEHLAWSTHQGQYFNDLLAAPFTAETLQVVCDHVDEVQEVLKRPLLLENPATYIAFETSTIDEVDFLTAVSQRTGCGLLLDVNNVYVSCINHQRDPEDYLRCFPLNRVGEIHLAGHGTDRDDAGAPLLIDAHDRAVCDEVWRLYELVLERGGLLPVLIERDNDIPPWPELFAEAQKAEQLMDAHRAARAREVTV